ncbi:MAG: hypothetical protein RO469_18160 [Thermincola sp.]|jgi:hypothetical protein|nr:hypothetical protein [Thermincola sp.]MDT3701625.1 hypothetical protein [Thermincola sp.]
MDIQLLNSSELPKGFIYPESFLKAVRLNLTYLEPWYIMNSSDVQQRIKGMQVRYPKRILIPFARRGDNDDVACFELNKGEEVQIIHDFASVGYEQRNVYKSFWNWFRDAIEEMINFD